MRVFIRCLLIVGLLTNAALIAPRSSLWAFQTPPTESKEQRDARMGWWREARFGMFIHWGIYALPAGTYQGKRVGGAGEWIMHDAKIPVARYETFAPQFNPVKFRADEWAAIAQAAGIKYMVITAKHCDGFAMYKSTASKYNIVDATPFKRDPLAELSTACAARGIRLGFYYSHCWDWHEPNATGLVNDWDFPPLNKRNPDAYFRLKSLPQVEELAAHYKPSLIWFDVPDLTRQRSEEFMTVIKRHVPDCIVNDRIGNGLGDYATPEQFIPAGGMQGRDWETCMTINDTWGYKSYDTNFKSTETLLRNLIDIASKGGNYLLNVGPTAEGLIPEAEVQRLKEMGGWLKVNGEAIYGTSAGPLMKAPAWGRVTQRPGKLYLHVFDWPVTGNLLLPITGNVVKAYLLTAPGRTLAFSASDDGVEIRVPAKPVDPIASVIVVEIHGDVRPLDTARVVQGADGTIRLAVTDAEIVGSGARLFGDREKFVGYWVNAGDYVEWAVKVARPGDFDVVVNYACEPGSAGSEFKLVIGDKSIGGKISSTGSWDDYRLLTLGTIHLDRPGTITIAVKPTKKPGLAVMNLRSVTLRPRRD